MTENESTPTTDPHRATTETTDSTDLMELLYKAALAGLVLLAAIAALQFYLSGSRAISIWVTREYEPLFQAAFNLVLLLLAGIGITWVVGRLNE